MQYFPLQEKTESSQKRVEGFEEALADYEGISIVSELYTDKVKDMSEAMADVLKRYPDLDGVFCTNEDVADMYLGLDKGENTPVMVGVDGDKRTAEGNHGRTGAWDRITGSI